MFRSGRWSAFLLGALSLLAAGCGGDDGPTTPPEDPNWHAFPGLNNLVTELAIYDGDLIAGGFFTRAGGATVNGIARWDGSSWSPLGQGLRGGPMGQSGVLAMVTFQGDLIVAGLFGQQCIHTVSSAVTLAHKVGVDQRTLWQRTDTLAYDEVVDDIVACDVPALGVTGTTAEHVVEHAVPYLMAQHSHGVVERHGVNELRVVQNTFAVGRHGWDAAILDDGQVAHDGGKERVVHNELGLGAAELVGC